jgi:hypothetical protein
MRWDSREEYKEEEKKRRQDDRQRLCGERRETQHMGNKQSLRLHGKISRSHAAGELPLPSTPEALASIARGIEPSKSGLTLS